MGSSGPLDGITVVDLSRALAGPHASMMLGDLGARVIKVESPGGGDDTRSWGPPFVGPDDSISTYFLSANRNKESVVLDMKDPADSNVLARLIRSADVLIENFRPGVLDRLGFPVARLTELNPRLITLAISGFGDGGPEGERAGYDQIAQGEAGIMSVTGPDPATPTKVGVPIGDVAAGMYGAFGVLAALHERERTGRGSVVRTSLLGALVGMHAFQGTVWTVAHRVPVTQGAHHPSICPYGLFHASDGVVQIAVGSESLWRRFAPAFNLPVDDARFAVNSDRVRHAGELREAVDAAFAEFTTEALLEKLDAIGVPAGRVRNLQQVYEWDQVRSQGLIIDVDHPVLGRMQLPGPPLRFFDIEGSEWHRTHAAPPLYGEHTTAVREEFAP
ncbi:CaiB/BaiF CoA transferase family protein [Gryllotalpicola reticulitermitis]|uniref:CaiB/BaiF CoA transferase family protein n=1 Tax=Gryllotalpicola reticulitermitis TaxID=1184153 RepID=A0ABV8Q2I8_9MICO